MISKTPFRQDLILGALNKLLSPEQYIFHGEDLKRLAIDSSPGARGNALGIVLPKNEQQLIDIMALCYEHRCPVVPSGGRTGYAGGAIAKNNELVISLDKMNSILDIDKKSQSICVEAGIKTDMVNFHLAQSNFYYPIQFAASGSSSIGGNIATNAGGIHVLRYGPTRNWVLALNLVDGQGKLHKLGRNVLKDNSGLDLKNLVIASEGILGIISQATLRLTSKPSQLSTLLLACRNYEQMLDIYRLAQDSSLTLHAFEYFDHTCMRYALQGGLLSPFGVKHDYYLVLDFDNPCRQLPQSNVYLEDFLTKLHTKGLVNDGFLAANSKQAAEFWKFRERISEALTLGQIVHKNDIAIALSNLPNFAKQISKIITDIHPGLISAFFGHLGDGNIHANILKPPSMELGLFRDLIAKQLDPQTFALVKQYQGSLSAEHGIGLIKKNHLFSRHSHDQIDIMRGIKKLFDPAGILNPGKIFD